ncbi:MAG: 30S ribosomal protein S16 [Hyphomicrobiales bacterium]
MIKIRLRRVGKTKRPYYRVIVARNEAKRDGAFLETLGSYDPHAVPPAVKLDEEKTREWLGKGAQPSEAAEKILRRAGIITTPAPERKRPAAAAAGGAATATATAPAAGATPPAAAEAAEESAAADEAAIQEEEAQ